MLSPRTTVPPRFSRSRRAHRWATRGRLLLCLGLPAVASGCPADPALPATPQQVAPQAAELPEVDVAATFVAEAEAIAIRGNHLVGQASPYLEAHAHNPVDWYPWGEEALQKALREDKPIFLSIGYSTCHWCHVMEEESFEDAKTAAFLNRHFVSIKVDRERRPDLDALFISAVGAMGASTGWPLTVFLTPQLEPFFGGTYFPPETKHGRPGFPDVLEEVRSTWATDGENAAKRGAATLARVQARANAAAGAAGAPIPPEVLLRTVERLDEARDTERGGFGSRRKFPNPPLLLAELRAAQRGDENARTHLALTLDEMAAGGIRDHVRGSFHRYAVDARWHVPHFEKMLYDNAQLAALYIEAGLTLEQPAWVTVGRAVLDDLLAHWRVEGGGFIVGFDADDPGGEGAYYTWSPAELRGALGDALGERVVETFGVTERGERDLGGRAVLHRKLGVAMDAELEGALATLEPLRAKRPPPATDDKVLVAWNALAIEALAKAGRWLDEPRYTEAASAAASVLWSRCWNAGALARGTRAQDVLGPGFVSDYASLGVAFVALHAATADVEWLVRARTLQRAVLERFYDPKGQVFARTDDAHDIPVRLPDLDDGVQPSGGAMATALELQLAALAGDSTAEDRGRAVLGRVAPSLLRQPMSRGAWLQWLDFAQNQAYEVVIAGDPEAPETSALWAEVAHRTSPRLLVARVGADGVSEAQATVLPALEGKRALRGVATAYVCQRGSCKAPTGDPKALRAQLDRSLETLVAPG